MNTTPAPNTPITDEPVIYISLGSNINSEKNMLSAIDVLKPQLSKCHTSPVYRSPAVGMQGADFYNAVIAGGTQRSIINVINWLRDTELAFGRVRTDNKFTSRTLDLDLLLYGQTVLDPSDERATRLPHPDIIDQAYVLQPLADIAATIIHPQYDCTVARLLANLKNQHPEKFTSLVRVNL